jgi:sugar phosphate isomerase/epimerase
MEIDRRKFITLTSTAGAGLLLPATEIIPAFNPEPGMLNTGFELKIMGTNWGYPGNLDAFCAHAKKEGYDGIEMWWPMQQADQDELFAALQKHQLDIGFLCAGSQPDPAEHLQYFTRMVDAAARNTVQRPLYINCHSGRDHFSFAQNKRFIDHTTALSRETGITICHETHRSRMLFAAHVARNFIEQIPELKLTFDVSHWCNVHETLLHDQAETVALALDRVEHIHARIGHPEGPQLNDPRAPEWEAAVKQHFDWWDVVIARKKKQGERMTILTEFGPPDYMPTLPYTRQPLGDQWAINAHMMRELRKRYA